jgi:WD40 repeat protein
LTASWDSTACLFEVNTGKLLRILGGHNSWVRFAIFSPDGKLAITASGSKVHIFELATGEQKRILDVHKAEVTSLACSQDGKLVLMACSDRTARVYEVMSGKKKQILGEHSDDFFSANFSPDDKLVLTTSRENVRLFEVQSGRQLQVFREPNGWINSAVFSSEGRYILTSNMDNAARIWDVSGGRELHNFKGKTCDVNIAVLSSDENYALLAGDTAAIIFDVFHGIVVHSFSGHFMEIASATISSDDKMIMTTGDFSARIYSAIDGKDLHTLNGHMSWVWYAEFCQNGKYALTASMDSTVRIWEVATGEALYILSGSHLAIFSPDGTLVLTANCNNTASIYEVESGKELLILKGHTGFINSLEFSPDGKLAITGSKDSTALIFDVITGRLVQVIGHTDEVTSAVFSPDGSLALTASSDKSARIFDVASGRNLQVLEGHTDWIRSAVFSPDGNFVLTAGGDHTARLFEVSSGKEFFVFKGHERDVRSAVFSHDGKKVLTSSIDHRTFFWETATGKPIYERIQLENENYLVKLPNSPYYMCSKDASKMLHYVTPSLRVIGFDQLDPVYNRPDIVLDSIGKYFGNEDRGMIEEYKKAWEKRIERLGLDKDKLASGEIAVPNAEISNADQILYDNSDGKVVVHVKANDPKYNLRRYNVLVNEVPVYGSQGISIAELNTKQWERTDTIALSIGNNKIQVSVMNELGLENFKYPTYVNYTPKNEIESTTYYIGIGVNDFNDASRKLNYCVKDVQDLAQAFARNQSKVDTLVFTNSEVTKENILALKSYLQKNTTVNDKVIISCSSHGLLDDSLNFYLATYDVDFTHPEIRGLAYEDLEGLLDGIPSRQKILLLDACNSGENERKFIDRNRGNEIAMNEQKRGEELEVANQEINSFQKMNELFVNVRNNTGSVVISAAGGLQNALEAIEVDGKEIENGAFTFSVLECLNSKQNLKVNDLKLYVEKRVEEITKGKQKPTSRQETMEVDWVVRKF